jgi:hypothetical protein
VRTLKERLERSTEETKAEKDAALSWVAAEKVKFEAWAQERRLQIAKEKRAALKEVRR